MITDALMRVSSAQLLTTTAVSTNTIDLLQAHDVGEGEEMFMTFVLPAAMTGGTSCVFEAISTSDAALTTNIVSLGSTGAILTAALLINSMFIIKINPVFGSLVQRYLGARYTIVGTYTAGSVTTDVCVDAQDGKKFYPSGFSVT